MSRATSVSLLPNKTTASSKPENPCSQDEFYHGVATRPSSADQNHRYATFPKDQGRQRHRRRHVSNQHANVDGKVHAKHEDHEEKEGQRQDDACHREQNDEPRIIIDEFPDDHADHHHEKRKDRQSHHSASRAITHDESSAARPRRAETAGASATRRHRCCTCRNARHRPPRRARPCRRPRRWRPRRPARHSRQPCRS